MEVTTPGTEPEITSGANRSPRIACYAHPEAPAVASCHRCFRQLCSVCTINDGSFVPRCVDCTRRQRLLRWILSGVAVLCLVSSTVAASRFIHGYRKPYGYDY